MEKSNVLKNQKGFTLIEIIAVLVILGILAAVAVPKYISLQADAANSAAMQAVAEGGARVNSAAASFILTNRVVPTQLSDLTGLSTAAAITASETSGDYTIGYADIAGETSIRVTATGNAATGGTATNDFPLPQ